MRALALEKKTEKQGRKDVNDRSRLSRGGLNQVRHKSFFFAREVKFWTFL